ncbi:MAG: prolipoprotein diacylglyceryl transferase [Saprospirales bacterium]|nr:prolipoprotein diacylglyceryl transferase [Saprospirales bacterium]MBK8922434.1 prolipoprotein diacylglyceryl transferase [Saprospirales bacterium]
MYPDLSYLFHALIGTQPDNWLSVFKTFGFFLALAFLASAVTFYVELRRKAREGFFRPERVTITEGKPTSPTEIAMNALVGLILGGKGLYAVQHFSDFRHDPASIILSGKMHWPAALIGALLLGGLSWYEGWRKRKEKPVSREMDVWPHDRISELTVWAAVGGIAGAKFFDVFDNWDSFLQDPAGALLSGGGLAFYGGLVLGFIAVVTYLWRHGIPFLHAADAVAPALTAGYGVGRIGCQLSGDGDWGIVNQAPKPDWLGFLPDWMWATTYPHNVLNTAATEPVSSVPIEGCTWEYCMQLSMPVFPTPFYETMMMLVVFGVLWALRKRLQAPGLLFFAYLALIAAERFLIEKIRVNVHHDVMGIRMSQAEIISVLLLLISLAGSIYVWRRYQANPGKG